jgi:tetratricopeptide (TPR) repeat protein
LVPEIWSPKRVWHWVKARQRRFRNFKLATAAAMLALILWLTARPASHLIKEFWARRLAGEASILMENEQWQNAERKIQDALRLSFTEPAVWRTQARLLSRIGQNQEAVLWWQRIADSGPLSIADHRDYAAAALSAHDLITADGQVRELLGGNANPGSPDFVVAAMLASARGYKKSALDYAGRVLADSGATPRDKLGAATVTFSNIAPDSELYRRSYDYVVSVARNESENIALYALTILARQAPPTAATNLSPPDVMPPAEIADRLERHPKARAFHRMLAMEVRARIEPGKTDQLIENAVQKFGKADDESLTMLSSWLYNREKYETILKVVTPERASRSRDLFIQRVDALASLKRYSELKDMLLEEQSVVDPSTQHMFLAVVSAKLGKTVVSENEWDRALQGADSLQKLIALASYAEQNGALETADAAYARAIAKQSKLRAAYAARLRLAEALGDTARAHIMAKEIVRLWPDDMATRVHEIYLRLLLDPSGTEAKTAEEEVARIAAKNPWDGAAQTTLALARLRQGRMAAALEAAPQPGPGVPASPALAVAWAANGWKDKAQEEIKKLATVKLLPEERALIAPLLADQRVRQ